MGGGRGGGGTFGGGMKVAGLGLTRQPPLEARAVAAGLGGRTGTGVTGDTGEETAEDDDDDEETEVVVEMGPEDATTGLNMVMKGLVAKFPGTAPKLLDAVDDARAGETSEKRQTIFKNKDALKMNPP